MRWTAEAETWKGVEVVEEAKTLKGLMWLISTSHEDTDAHYKKTGINGVYYYESPGGKHYTIRRESA